MIGIPPQPAKKTYFLGPAYDDLTLALEGAWEARRDNCKRLWDTEDESRVFFSRGFACGLWIGTVVVGFLFGIVYFVATLACSLAVLAAVLVLRGTDWAYRSLWRIGRACPECYEKGMPQYRCPQCGVRHTDLSPGLYGAFRRVCQCGTNLPVLHASIRRVLSSSCPRCQRPLVDMKSRPVHLAFVGGPASGKSNFLYMGVERLMQSYREAGYERMEFADHESSQAVKTRREGFANGRVADKTATMVPRAIRFLLWKPKSPAPTNIHFYDGAGEAFDSEQGTAGLSYFDAADGIVFVIDPLAIESFFERWQGEISRLGLHTSLTDPEDAFRRMLAPLQRAARSRVRQRLKVRLAIVVGKADLFDILGEIEACLARHAQTLTPQRRSPDPAELESAAVRQWLEEQGMGNLLRAAENDFGEVRYFAASALGRIPLRGDLRPFRATGVLAPMLWSLGRVFDWSAPVPPPARSFAALPHVQLPTYASDVVPWTTPTEWWSDIRLGPRIALGAATLLVLFLALFTFFCRGR